MKLKNYDELTELQRMAIINFIADILEHQVDRISMMGEDDVNAFSIIKIAEGVERLGNTDYKGV